MPPAQDVSYALSRIRAVINPKKEAEKATRDIRLGLERIARVVPDIQEWQGVHVGGTNGKGSICAYLSGLFTLAGISYGRYVSPAFPEKHNAVTINGRYVNPRVYELATHKVSTLYQRRQRGWRLASSESPGPLSPFELETATAFRVFNELRVRYGIVEVGMGGADDATNVMRRKAVTVISKIDLDHQEYLGRTIEDIAKVKAGIMRPGVPCVVDHTNPPTVIKVLRDHASKIGARIALTWKAEPFLSTLDNDRWQLEDYQIQNLLCAALAFRHLFPYQEINLDRLLDMEPYLPGRMEWVGISNLTKGHYSAPVLVDAAHNLLGMESLAKYTDNHLRSNDKPVTWVVGLSSSTTKPFTKMLQTLVRPQDNVAFVEYDQQENEPQATPAQMGRDILRHIVANRDRIYDGKPSIEHAIEWAAQKAGSGQLVITGSLYLIRDLYLLKGLERSRDVPDRKPGSSQLWRFSKLWGQRSLTPGEYKEFRSAKSHWQRHQLELAMKKIQGGSDEHLSGREVPSPQQSQPRELPDRSAQGESAQGPPGEPSVQGEEMRAQEKAPQQQSTEEHSEAATPNQVSATDESAEEVSAPSNTSQQLQRNSAPKEETRTYPRNEIDELAEQEPPKARIQELTTLRERAIRHKRQLIGYQAALRSIGRDIEHETQQGKTVDGVLSQLQQDAELLRKQADKHHEAHEEVMEELRVHPDAPKEYALTHAEIFGRPPRSFSSTFSAATELDVVEPTTETSEAWLEEEAQEEEEVVEVVKKDFWGRPIGIDQPATPGHSTSSWDHLEAQISKGRRTG